MQEIWGYILNNKEWIFSGIGVAIISTVFWFLFKRRSLTDKSNGQNQKSGKNSINIQVGESLNIGDRNESDSKRR